MNALEKLDVEGATLPERYVAARQALQAAHKVDECKDWADKAQALASYAKQIKDETLLNTAKRIQGRAVRRAGQLLQEIESGSGKNCGKNGTEPPLSVTRKSAAEEAGMSERQRKTALSVAGIDDDDFEAAIESDNPPTVTDLAKRRKDPLECEMRAIIGDGAMDDQEAFHASIHIAGAMDDLIEKIEKAPRMERILETMSERKTAEFNGKLLRLIYALDDLTKHFGEN